MTHPTPTPRPPRRTPWLRELVVIVLIKLVVLAGLWWAFVRDQRVPVQADEPALPWLSSTRSTTESAHHDQ